MSEKSNQQRGLVLKTTTLMSGVLLALGVESLLEDFTIVSIQWASLLVRLGLLILVVWIAQLLASWEKFYEDVGADKFPFGGIPHLWVNVLYISFVYLACKNHGNYFLVLVFISLIAILDFIDSGLEWKLSNHRVLREVNHNWLIRDVATLTPSLLIAWAIFVFYEKTNASNLSVLSGVFFFIGVAINYIFDLWINRYFYGTSDFWNAVFRRFKRLKNK